MERATVRWRQPCHRWVPSLCTRVRFDSLVSRRCSLQHPCNSVARAPDAHRTTSISQLTQAPIPHCLMLAGVFGEQDAYVSSVGIICSPGVYTSAQYCTALRCRHTCSIDVSSRMTLHPEQLQTPPLCQSLAMSRQLRTSLACCVGGHLTAMCGGL